MSRTFFRRLLVPAAAAATLLGGFGAAVLAARDVRGDGFFRPWSATPDASAADRYHYSLTVRVRPLLFWITRKGVGSGRITRADGQGSTRLFELLIGSDPARTPMHINRWGYVAEVHRDEAVAILGLMTEANEQTVEEAGRTVNGRPRAEHRFKAIRATVAEGTASAQVVRISLAEDFTLHDLPAVLGQLPEGGAATARVQLPDGVRPGFLGAVADLVRETIEAARSSNAGPRTPSATYVWDRGLYDLTCSSRPFRAPKDEAIRCSGCLESEFRIRNRARGDKTTFRLAYATDGPLAGIPVRIVYRPRWWFEAELTLAEAR